MSNVELPLTVARTESGLRFTFPALGADAVRCVRGPDQIARVIAEALTAHDTLTAARARAGYTGRHGTGGDCHHPACRYAAGQDRHNPADWRRLKAGQMNRWNPKTHRMDLPCEEGSWLCPTGRVYQPKSRRVPKEARRMAEIADAMTTAGEYPPLEAVQ